MDSSSRCSQESSDDVYNRSNLSDYTGTRPKFKTKPQPRLSKSVTSLLESSFSDSTNSSSKSWKNKRRHKNRGGGNSGGCGKPLPMGIFWDIENCQVPKNTSASAIVQRIREYFLKDYYEAEFIVVCDVKKERSQVVDELHDSQINLIHVSSTSKNAADEKLKQSLRRFAETFRAPSCVILLSGDINFAGDLSDLRYRKKMRVILIHNSNVADALILCANEHYDFSCITEGLPKEKQKDGTPTISYMMITNLPQSVNSSIIKKRINFLVRNCGGRVDEVIKDEGVAIVRFCNQDFANRAQKRIQGEDVGGNKIQVIVTPFRNYAGKKIKGGEAAVLQSQGYRSTGLDQTSRKFDASPHLQQQLDQSYGAVARRPRTPQENTRTNHLRRNSTSSDISEEYVDNSKNNQPVDLIISNLDASFSVKELKRLLSNMLNEYAMVLSMNISSANDGYPVAFIKVNNQQSAQFVISKLHRQRLGHKRLVISYVQSNSPDSDELRAMVISILQEAPNNEMPLFKFMDLFESRYHCTVSVSDVNKLKDICKITEEGACRMISFVSEIKGSPLLNLSKTLVPYCTVHCANGRYQNLGWCALNTVETPNLMISLKLFATKINLLLNLHLGCMPLLSFQACYEQEFNENLPIDFNGVPLEHLVSCIDNVELKTSGPNKNIKIIKREIKCGDSDEENFFKSIPPSLAPNLNLFCRELVDLLKTTEKCQLLVSKFIPAYHHHFGRQCHVANYGYTKLLDLLEAVPHVIQIMDDGSRKIITLSHQAQIRRFTSDLLKVLKSQPLKQISSDDYPMAYEKVMNRSFSPVDYGLCYFEDLLEQVPANIIEITKTDTNCTIISTPKREQTAKEIMRTKQFVMEAIDILRYSPYCTMLFNKFVPAYHHHFGHQCRVSLYGFKRLIELFEAIPDVIKIQEMFDNERTITLTLDQSFKVLGFEIMSLIKNSSPTTIGLEDLPELFLKKCGYSLIPQFWACQTVEELIKNISYYVVVRDSVLHMANPNFFLDLKIRTWALLLKPPYSMDCVALKSEFQSTYNYDVSLNDFKQLREVISLSSTNDTIYITLTRDYQFAAKLYYLLYTNGGTIQYSNLDRLYSQNFGTKLSLTEYNFNSVDDLYNSFDFLLFSRWYKKDSLTLNRSLADYQVALPTQIINSYQLMKPLSSQQQSQQQQHNLMETPDRSIKRISPPKPDTPPTPGTTIWSPSLRESGLNLNIKLPLNVNPRFVSNPFDLYSPARSLWMGFACGKAPDPAELPSPDKLIKKNLSVESTDSGMNSKLESSDNEQPNSGGSQLMDFAAILSKKS